MDTWNKQKIKQAILDAAQDWVAEKSDKFSYEDYKKLERTNSEEIQIDDSDACNDIVRVNMPGIKEQLLDDIDSFRW